MDKKITIAVTSIVIVALAVLVLAISKRPADPRIQQDLRPGVMYVNAEDALEAGDEAEAIKTFVAILNEHPESKYSVRASMSLADLYKAKGDIKKAEYYYNRAARGPAEVKKAEAEETLETQESFEVDKAPPLKLADVKDGSIEYTVKPGDSLYAIARRYNTTVPLIKKMNALSSNTIRVGQRLKVNAATFSILVDKSENKLILKKDGEPFKTYTVSTGKDNSTPVGVYKIVDKVIDAPWTKPTGEVVLPGDPDYELGARWMAINLPGYGIHGTNDETSIGGQVTAGCVRMYNSEVIELYEIVTVGTEVEIVD